MPVGEDQNDYEIRCGSCNFLLGYGTGSRPHDITCRYCQFGWDYFCERIAGTKPPTNLTDIFKDWITWAESRFLKTGMFYAAQKQETSRMEVEKLVNTLAYEMRIEDKYND